MKNLIEISKIVTKKKVRKIEIFDDHTLKNKKSKFNEFYEALLLGKFKNDRDAANFLYSCSPTDDKYRQLKSRFKKRLLNTLFFLDINLPSTSNYERAYYSCNKDWTLVQILISNKANHTGAALAKSILTTALKFKFSDIIVSCCRLLRSYSAENGLEKEFDTYDAHLKAFNPILNAELQADEIFERVKLQYQKNSLNEPELESKLQEYCDQLISISESYESPVIFYKMYLVWAYRFEMFQNFESMLEVCNKAEQYIADNPIFHQVEMLATFHLMKMSAYLHLKDFKNGKINAERCLKSFKQGSEIWFIFMEYYFLLAMHCEQYIQAIAIYNTASSNTKIKKLSPNLREKWNLFNIYLNYIIETHSESNPVLETLRQKRFRLNPFLNDQILYPKSQKAFSPLALIAQTLYMIDRKNYNLASEKIDRLKTIASRQLKKEEDVRTIQFIQLIQQLYKADYSSSKVPTQSKYYDKLVNKPFYYRGKINELEIIPYEKLWSILLSRL